MERETQSTVLQDEITLKDLILKGKEWFSYLLKKWKIILLATLIGGIFGILYAYFKKPIYTASLTFAIEDSQSSGGLGSALGLAGSLGLDLGGSGGGVFEGANLTELFKSRSMVEKTLLSPIAIGNDTISLAEMYVRTTHWREQWEGKSELESITFEPTAQRTAFSRTKDSLLGVMYHNLSENNLTVGQRDKKIAIIAIDVKAPDELFAKYFTESLVKNVSDFYKATKSKKARDNMDILQKQTDSVRSELNKAIAGVAIANDNTFNLNPALNIKRTPSAKRQVDVQANTAILTELVKQGELAKVAVRKETPLIQVIDRPILPLEKEDVSFIKGFILGSFLTTIFVILYLIGRRIYYNILTS